MALSFSVKDVGLNPDVNKLTGGFRHCKLKEARITLDNSYVTGGWAVTAANVGMAREIVRGVANPVYGHPLEFLIQSDGSALLKAYKNAGDSLFLPISLMCLKEASNFDVGAIAANGGVLASDTTPILEAINDATDGCQRLVWAATNVDQVVFQVALPPDLDTSKDLTLYTRIASEGTDAVGFTVDSFFDTADTKVVDTSQTNGTTAYLDKTTTIAAADIPAGARILTVGLTPVAHASHKLYLAGLWLEGYRLVELDSGSARLNGKIVDALVVGY